MGEVMEKARKRAAPEGLSLSRRMRLGWLALFAGTSISSAAAAPSGEASVASPTVTVAASGQCARVPTPSAARSGRTLPESAEQWPAQTAAPEGAPNVLIWMIDDAGFGLLSAYGGLVQTPNLERLASRCARRRASRS
jgi:hypothetical protein